jgi:hypothetical protein
VRAFGGRALEVEQRDMRTLAREQDRCGAAVADAIVQRARAGDDRDAPLQSHLWHFCSPWLGVRLSAPRAACGLSRLLQTRRLSSLIHIRWDLLQDKS